MSILRNLNYMKRFVHHPCATPNPLMLIEFALEAAAPVLLELLSADILDKALPQGKQAWRKRASGSNRGPQPPAGGTNPSVGHGRKAGGRFGRKSFGKKVGPKEWLFEMVDAEQTGMYWWLVADLATEFMARWTTLIYLKQGCPFEHECYREGPFAGIYIDAGESPQVLPILSTGVVASGGLAIQQLRKGTFSISYNCRILRFNSDEPPSAARVELRGGIGSGRVWSSGAGGAVDPAGGINSGGFHNFTPKSQSLHDFDGDAPDPLSNFQLILVNDAPDETVGTVDGWIALSSGFCNNTAPTIPWDVNHLIPAPHGHIKGPGPKNPFNP